MKNKLLCASIAILLVGGCGGSSSDDSAPNTQTYLAKAESSNITNPM